MLKISNSVVSSQALAGEVGMSSELDEVARALFNGQLPNIWRKLAPATLKSLGNWMEHFMKRLSQYNRWVSGWIMYEKYLMNFGANRPSTKFNTGTMC